MSVITKEHAEKMLRLWLEAEEAVTTGQSYSIGSRSLTRVNLAEIRGSITYWESRLAQLESGRKGIRVIRAVPRCF